MRHITIGAAVFCAASLAPFASPAFAQAAMTAEACQPLTAENLEACCEAENWRELILPGDVAFCPPLNAADTDSGRTAQPLASNGSEAPVNGSEPPANGSEAPAGNPGNEAEVGGAGEQDKGAPGDPSGTKGSSN